MRALESRAVINAVASHRHHFAVLLKSGNNRQLNIWRDAAVDFCSFDKLALLLFVHRQKFLTSYHPLGAQTNLAADTPRRLGVVAS